MIGLVTELHLADAALGDENPQEDFDDQVTKLMNVAEIDPTSMNPSCSISFALLSLVSSLTSVTAVHRRHEATSRLDTVCQKGVPVQEPRTKWIGGASNGAVLIATCVRRFEFDTMKDGMHVLDMFYSISCGGLRTVLEAGYVVTYYISF